MNSTRQIRSIGTQLETIYPDKVYIPEQDLLGNPQADVMKERVAEYYFFRDMIWEMIFMERTNPYTNDPYFAFARPSVLNEYEWPEIKLENTFRYVIDCRVPTNRPNQYEICFLSISYDFGVSPAHPVEIRFMLIYTEAMHMGTDLSLLLDLSSLGTKIASCIVRALEG